MLCGASCKDPTAKAPAPATEFKGRIQIPLPVNRVLVDVNGRQLDCTIIGKNALNLVVVRKGDGNRLTVPVEMLSDADQDFVAGLLDQRPPTEVAEDKGDPRIAGIQRRIESIQEKIFDIESEMADPRLRTIGGGGGRETPRLRGLRTEMDKLESERIGLEADLRKLLRNQRNK